MSPDEINMDLAISFVNENLIKSMRKSRRISPLSLPKDLGGSKGRVRYNTLCDRLSQSEYSIGMVRRHNRAIQLRRIHHPVSISMRG